MHTPDELAFTVIYKQQSSLGWKQPCRRHLANGWSLDYSTNVTLNNNCNMFGKLNNKYTEEYLFLQMNFTGIQHMQNYFHKV